MSLVVVVCDEPGWRYRRGCILENLGTVQGGWWLAGWLEHHCTPLHYNLGSLVRAQPGSARRVTLRTTVLPKPGEYCADLSLSLQSGGQHVDMQLLE